MFASLECEWYVTRGVYTPLTQQTPHARAGGRHSLNPKMTWRSLSVFRIWLSCSGHPVPSACTTCGNDYVGKDATPLSLGL